MAKPKNLRRPITIEIAGHRVALVTLGHCAEAVGRTTACLKNWERLGIFPPAEYRLSRSRIRLYPEDFVRAIRCIAREEGFGRSLDRADWARVGAEIWKAHEDALEPLRRLANGVEVDDKPTAQSDDGLQGSVR